MSGELLVYMDGALSRPINAHRIVLLFGRTTNSSRFAVCPKNFNLFLQSRVEINMDSYFIYLNFTYDK